MNQSGLGVRCRLRPSSYQEIRKNSQTLCEISNSQSIRFFSEIPKEINVLTAALTGDYKVHSEEEAQGIAKKFYQ